MKILNRIDGYINERLGEKGRTKEGMHEKRGTAKVKRAAGYLEIAIKLLADARKFDIYTPEGLKASKDEIQTLTNMRKELEARVISLGEEKIVEGKMQKGYWVSLHGRAGELDSAFVKDKKGIKAVLIDWSSTLSDGDTIKIKKGESER